MYKISVFLPKHIKTFWNYQWIAILPSNSRLTLLSSDIQMAVCRLKLWRSEPNNPLVSIFPTFRFLACQKKNLHFWVPDKPYWESIGPKLNALSDRIDIPCHSQRCCKRIILYMPCVSWTNYFCYKNSIYIHNLLTKLFFLFKTILLFLYRIRIIKKNKYSQKIVRTRIIYRDLLSYSIRRFYYKIWWSCA